MSMESHALAASVGTLAVSQLHDTLHWIHLAVINGYGTAPFGQGKTIRMAVHNHDPARTLDLGRAGCHQTDGSSAIDDDRLTGHHSCQLRGMPARGKDVRQHDVVVLALARVLGEFQTVEVGVGHTKILS